MMATVEQVAAPCGLRALAAEPGEQAHARGDREHQEPDVRERRERDLGADDQLVVGPHHLPGCPATDADGEPTPRARVPAVGTRGDGAQHRSGDDGGELTEVADDQQGLLARPGDPEQSDENKSEDGRENGELPGAPVRRGIGLAVRANPGR